MVNKCMICKTSCKDKKFRGRFICSDCLNSVLVINYYGEKRNTMIFKMTEKNLSGSEESREFFEKNKGHVMVFLSDKSFKEGDSAMIEGDYLIKDNIQSVLEMQSLTHFSQFFRLLILDGYFDTEEQEKRSKILETCTDKFRNILLTEQEKKSK